jgi:hypothetical protein
MIDQDSNINFMRDLAALLREKALESKQEAKTGGDFEKGRQIAYYEVLSLIQEQACVFDINLVEIGLNDFDADRDLL